MGKDIFSYIKYSYDTVLLCWGLYRAVTVGEMSVCQELPCVGVLDIMAAELKDETTINDTPNPYSRGSIYTTRSMFTKSVFIYFTFCIEGYPSPRGRGGKFNKVGLKL
jgi:hypothetical protein